MGSPTLQPAEVEVEQTATGEPADAKLPAEVYGSPTATVEENCMVGLQAECRLGGTWVEHPQKVLEGPCCSSDFPS
jgi:hypothetical protein